METSNYSENKTKNIETTDLINAIKSKCILMGIFSFLDRNRELNIIKYNKKIQKLLSIDIEYYKKISGRYIEGGRNGIVKEYLLATNNLIFEGEYLNGKQFKGIGYNYNRNIIFELKEGKGKEYYDNGKLYLKEITLMEKDGMEYIMI